MNRLRINTVFGKYFLIACQEASEFELENTHIFSGISQSVLQIYNGKNYVSEYIY